jgi:hypothetical protein
LRCRIERGGRGELRGALTGGGREGKRPASGVNAGGGSLYGRLRFWYEWHSSDPPATRGRAGCATRRDGAQDGRGVVHRRSLVSVPEMAAGAAWCVQRRRAPDGEARKPRAPGLGHAGRGDAFNRVEGAGCTAWRARHGRQGKGGCWRKPCPPWTLRSWGSGPRWAFAGGLVAGSGCWAGAEMAAGSDQYAGRLERFDGLRKSLGGFS